MATVLASTKRWFISHEQATFFIKVVLGSLMIALFAQISVPMYPVPITGQTLAVTVVGLSLGRKAGIAAVLLYLFQGAIGLPVFASGSAGIAAFFGPTGGYLYGFIATVAILGYFSDKGIVRALLNRYGVTRPRCTQCTICGRSPCSDSKIPRLYIKELLYEHRSCTYRYYRHIRIRSDSLVFFRP